MVATKLQYESRRKTPTLQHQDAKEEEDMVRLSKNTNLRIVSDVALILEEDLKLVHPIVKPLFYKKFLQTLPQETDSNIFTKIGNL